MDIQELVQLAKEVKGVGDWDTAAIIRVGGALAAKVNSLKNLSGGEKQKLVLQIVRKVLDQAAVQELAAKDLTKGQLEAIQARYEKLKFAVEDVLPASLELAINAARGKMDLKKIKPSIWVKFCSCFAGGVVSVLASQNLISEAQANQVTNVLRQAEEKAKTFAEAKEAGEAATEEKAALELRIPVQVESKPVEDKKEDVPDVVSKPEDTSQ